MTERSELLHLAAEYELSADQTQALIALQPKLSAPAFVHRVGVFAASLLGAGLVMWVAANWQTLSRFTRFGLLEGALLLCGALTMRRGNIRLPFALLAFICVGGVWAYFGQTYQTGADSWQLFGLWALLTLPFCLLIRHDVLWLPWSIVWMTTVSFWCYAHSGYTWGGRDVGTRVFWLSHAAQWGCVALLGRPLQPWTGASIWSLRGAVAMATFLTTSLGVSVLFGETVPPTYWYSVGILLVAWLWFVPASKFDIAALSALSLGENVLVFSGVARFLLKDHKGSEAAPFFVLALFAACLLALTVWGILSLISQQKKMGN